MEFSNSSSSACGTHAGTMQKNGYVVRELFGELRRDCLGLEEVEAAEIGGAMRRVPSRRMVGDTGLGPVTPTV